MRQVDHLQMFYFYFYNHKIPCISLSTFYDFIAKTNILSDGKLRNTDLDINFISSNGKDLNYP